MTMTGFPSPTLDVSHQAFPRRSCGPTLEHQPGEQSPPKRGSKHLPMNGPLAEGRALVPLRPRADFGMNSGRDGKHPNGQLLLQHVVHQQNFFTSRSRGRPQPKLRVERDACVVQLMPMNHKLHAVDVLDGAFGLPPLQQPLLIGIIPPGQRGGFHELRGHNGDPRRSVFQSSVKGIQSLRNEGDVVVT